MAHILGQDTFTFTTYSHNMDRTLIVFLIFVLFGCENLSGTFDVLIHYVSRGNGILPLLVVVIFLRILCFLDDLCVTVGDVWYFKWFGASILFSSSYVLLKDLTSL